MLTSKTKNTEEENKDRAAVLKEQETELRRTREEDEVEKEREAQEEIHRRTFIPTIKAIHPPVIPAESFVETMKDHEHRDDKLYRIGVKGIKAGKTSCAVFVCTSVRLLSLLDTAERDDFHDNHLDVMTQLTSLPKGTFELCSFYKFD